MTTETMQPFEKSFTVTPSNYYHSEESHYLLETFHQFPHGDFRPTFYNPFEIKHRRRTSRAQLKVLEKSFAENPKPNATVRRILAQKLDMTPRGVQIWFQNRRAKAKVQRKRSMESNTKSNGSNTTNTTDVLYSQFFANEPVITSKTNANFPLGEEPSCHVRSVATVAAQQAAAAAAAAAVQQQHSMLDMSNHCWLNMPIQPMDDFSWMAQQHQNTLIRRKSCPEMMSNDLLSPLDFSGFVNAEEYKERRLSECDFQTYYSSTFGLISEEENHSSNSSGSSTPGGGKRGYESHQPMPVDFYHDLRLEYPHTQQLTPPLTTSNANSPIFYDQEGCATNLLTNDMYSSLA
ncbi:hypothetical protein DFQ28_010121 [Apophysomyces sp. BC1034]|nr:hypothetical protein DFQ30_003582 [Apophysomyces sp. BC1015]KAG0179013.1 hypothetical protein DFQ29_002725 [Apophysomyces sp. BC1021]KAG0192122.1 hypothetical protein DFQ28_010121 [Apophysomyces sp. BC1034]